MSPLVEPLDGPELERIVTGLLNVSGAVHRVIEEEVGGREIEGDGIEVIRRVAERLRKMLVLFAEHHSDRELADITEFLAVAAILIAEQAGWDDVFDPDAFPEGGLPSR